MNKKHGFPVISIGEMILEYRSHVEDRNSIQNWFGCGALLFSQRLSVYKKKKKTVKNSIQGKESLREPLSDNSISKFMAL